MTGDPAALLRARARRLARPIAQAEQMGDEPLLLFAVGRARLAIAARHVRAVRAVRAITPVPGAPEALAGIVLDGGRPRLVWRLGTVIGVDDPPAAWTRLLLLDHDLAFGATTIDAVTRADPGRLAAAGVELLALATLLEDPRLTSAPRAPEKP